jgi:hypothetical protein
MYTITEICKEELTQFEVRKINNEDILGTFDTQDDAKAFVIEQVKKDFTPIQP